MGGASGSGQRETGIHLFRSNRAEVLVEVLASLLRLPSQVPADPFRPVEIVVGSLGMERWLRHELASRHGICANVEFPFPGQLVARLRGDPPRQGESQGAPELDPWSPEVLTWHLLELFDHALPSWGEREGVETLRAYLDRAVRASPPGSDAEPAPGATHEVGARELELAARVADIFDGYVTYRPAWAEAASAGDLELDPADPLRWQVALWRALEARFAAAGAPNAHLAAQIGALRRSGASVGATFHQPVRLFGLSALPPALLALLETVAREVAVELYLVCPSDRYWADLHARRDLVLPLAAHSSRDELGERMRAAFGEDPAPSHPLLSSLGRVARDLQLLVERWPDDLVRPRDLFVELTGGVARSVAFADPVPAQPRSGAPITALQWLQSDILHLRAPDEGHETTPDDDSIRFHACHGATRQVEVLREALLHLFDRHPHLEPRDVVVMCPDIDTYAPLISAVFDRGEVQRRPGPDGAPDLGPEGWGAQGAPRIPYQVADLSVRRQNPVAEALLGLLTLGGADQRVSASAALDLLALEPVRRRFGLDEDDLSTIQTWVRDAGIRWGIDAGDRARAGQPAEHQNTWRFGLERLAMGVVIADEGDPLSAGPQGRRVAPLDAMEGRRVGLLGRLMDFTEVLFGELERLADPRPVDAWVRALLGDPQASTSVERSGTLARLVQLGPEARWLDQRVRETLEGLAAAACAANSQRVLELDALRTALESRFSVASSSAQPHTGAVTFGTLMPYRSVPYRVVCLLGMDEDAFPRQPLRPRFDRVAMAPRVGDRDLRDEDRYLLLEAIGAAREHLIVTYAGRDLRSNERRPPAAPVGELMDVVRATFGDEAFEAMVVEHPLQAFSARNFAAGEPWSHDRRLLAGAEALAVGQGRAPVFFGASHEAPELHASNEGSATIGELVSFLQNPARYLLQRGYGIYLGDYREAAADREPTELDALGRWQLTRALLEQRLGEQREHEGAASRLARLRARGELPLGVAGELAVSTVSEAVDLLEAALETHAPELTAGLRAPPIPPAQLELLFETAGGPVSLLGSAGRRCGDALLWALPGAGLEHPRVLEPWLTYLAAVASIGSQGSPDGAVRRLVVGLAKAPGVGAAGSPGVALWELRVDDAAQARALLARYLTWALRGRRSPTPLFPRASPELVKRLRRRGHPFADLGFATGAALAAGELGEAGDDTEIGAWISEALDAARGKLTTGFASAGDLDEAHVARVWPEGWTDDADFVAHAAALWWPLLAAARRLDGPRGRGGRA